MSSTTNKPMHKEQTALSDSPEDKLKKALNMVLFMQTVASSRNVAVNKKYMALAKDVVAIINGDKSNHSYELI
jgi:hypothetical protein